MRFARRSLPLGITLSIGLVMGWTLATLRPTSVRADRGDPGFEDLLTAGPVLMEYNETLKGAVPRDAVYYLDYKGGRLLAAIPSPIQTGTVKKMLDSFAQRDLVADFKLTPGSGSPRFLMTTGTLNALNEAYAPLYVFETTSKQVASYRLVPQTFGTSTVPRFELLELRPLPPPLAAVATGR